MNDSAQKLKLQVNDKITHLSDKNTNQNMPDNFDAVWIFSDPREHYNSDKRNLLSRINYGISLAYEIIATRLDKSINEVTKDDMAHYGPMLIYSGTPEENEYLQTYIASPDGLLPGEKVFILGASFDQNGMFQSYNHTLNPLFSYPKEFVTIKHHVKNAMLLISHQEHLLKIMQYLEKYTVLPDILKVETLAIDQNLQLDKEYHEIMD